ncbi:uncharacterized protein TRIADDRAFT_28057 [Trichoplax adhaerens]|uniref:L-serine ammonia-lyase n=1 Tax=Trichoplax adhaerens TaxID=10228 RepID=B3S1X5_TRIAD|nr:hypothetical protein TRIADDRAFT_28057 [Trichoplax adhaerens]EDV23267.1 hypothetical protein TRIADDRAFT_28057 [Trichoplax adhaerens]|eukprot:XP_002114177.1 hypothetical protein TRIADDRAFT_28057 [Trichoplax adhaerens]
MSQDKLHIQTPLIESYPLSKLLKCPVYLKMENLQPSASFKIRGIGNICQKAIKNGCTHIIGSSGGNAGLAMAYATHKLAVKCTIVVPCPTPQHLKDTIVELGANLVVKGQIWNDAEAAAKEIAKETGGWYLPPFDHPDVWEGNSSIMDEIQSQIPEKPGALVVAVGGAGLLLGILQGMHRFGWSDVPIITAETEGTRSFAETFKAGELVTLPTITGIAKCLGARAVASECVKWLKIHTFHPVLVEDREAVNACSRFADDHRTLVQPACGAGLAVAYSGKLEELRQNGHIKTDKPIVIIVCGGYSVTHELMQGWKKEFNL